MSYGDMPRSSNVVWDGGATSRDRGGATVWLTGLPASGKSTLAKALELHLLDAGQPVGRLDGDNLRHGLCGDLGFGAVDREENVRRTAHVAGLLAGAGVVAVVALVSPYRSSRALARTIHDAVGLRFVEVFVDTPLEVCEARDPKGLYARARAGEIGEVTGIDDPYERPEDPDVHLVHPWTVDEAVERLARELAPRGVIAP